VLTVHDPTLDAIANTARTAISRRTVKRGHGDRMHTLFMSSTRTDGGGIPVSPVIANLSGKTESETYEVRR
jgi:hypothetical protein